MTARLLAVLTVVVAIAALKLGRAVFLPPVLAAFAIAVAWPVQSGLERRVPRWVALFGTIAVAVLVLAVIGGAFAWNGSKLVAMAPRLGDRIDALCAQASAWAARRGIESDGDWCGAQSAERLTHWLRSAAAAAYGATLTLALALGYFALGLLEVRDFEAKAARRLGHSSGAVLLDTVRTVAWKVRRHLIALTISSAVSGVATGLFALAMGLELALMWGVVTYLLNYIPIIGPTVAVVPPTLFALLQFDGVGRAAAVLAGVGAIQYVMGNFVDPKIEGRVLSLSPVAVLFTVAFWGWMWGVFGALLAVPLLAAIVVACDHFESTRWLAVLASDAHGKAAGRGERRGERRAADRTAPPA